jgi:hypothetical protein
MTGIGADHQYFSFALDHLAVFTNALNAGSHLHRPPASRLYTIPYGETNFLAVETESSKGETRTRQEEKAKRSNVE